MPKRIDRTTFDDIERLLHSGDHTCMEIGAKVGAAASLVEKIKKGDHFYQCDSAEQVRRRGNSARRKTYLPSPVQIELECARLLAERLPVDDDADGWRPPVVDASALGIA